MPRIDQSLHQAVMAEAASTGQLKRWCSTCGGHVTDQDRTRSKYCRQHRGAKKAQATDWDGVDSYGPSA